MSARTRLNSKELAELQRRRQASAEAAARGRAHRALPLSVVEAKALADRKPWPAPKNPRPFDGYPDFQPGEAVSGIEEEQAYNLRPQRRKEPPSMPWRELFAGLLVLLFTLSCVHVIATATKPATQVAKR